MSTEFPSNSSESNLESSFNNLPYKKQFFLVSVSIHKAFLPMDYHLSLMEDDLSEAEAEKTFNELVDEGYFLREKHPNGTTLYLLKNRLFYNDKLKTLDDWADESKL